MSLFTLKHPGWERTILWLSIFVLLVLLSGSVFRYFDVDEFETIHASWKIAQHETIYIDFFEHHHPFFYYLLSPLFIILQNSILTLYIARIFMFLLLMGTVFIVYKIAQLIFDKKVAALSVLLILTAEMFMDKAIEIRPDNMQTLLALLSIYFLFKFFSNKSQIKYLILSSLALGISFLFLQKSLIVFGLIIIILSYELIRKNIKFKLLFFYITIFISPFLLYLLYLWSTHSLTIYYRLNWIINMSYLHNATPFTDILFATIINSVLVLSYFIALFLPLNSLQKKLAFLSFGLLIYVFFVVSPGKQYFLPALCLMSILAGFSMHRLKNINKLVFNIAIIAIVVLPVSVFINKIYRMPNTKNQIPGIIYINNLVKTDDYIYDGDCKFNLFNKDINYFWFSLQPSLALETYKKLYGYEYDIYKAIDTYKPKLISDHLLDTDNPSIKGQYYSSGIYRNIYIKYE